MEDQDPPWLLYVALGLACAIKLPEEINHQRRRFFGNAAMDDATFARTAASFANPDHVAIVIHNCRWRLGLADRERQYDDLEKRLAAAPVITVPAITLEGDANGAPHPDPAAYRNKFSGKYASRVIRGGIGHNLPQEARQAFAQAVIDVNGFL